MLEETFTVPTLYRTAEGEEVVAPGNRDGVVVHAPTGHLAWETWRCENPECPGQPEGEWPYLFIWPSPFLQQGSDGAIKTVQPETEDDFRKLQEYADMKCPACLTKRNLAQETPAEADRYKNWCRKYELPAAKEAREQAAVRFREQLSPLPAPASRK